MCFKQDSPERRFLNRPPRVLISTCVDAKLRQSITKTVERLGGTITASAQDFTVFVTLDASGGDKDRGFTKSLNALSALASGMYPSFDLM